MDNIKDKYTYQKKIIGQEDLIEKSHQLRNKNKKIVFTNGCFDLIHIGHIYYLRESRLLGDVLIVAVNSDDSVKRLKGKHRPITTELERAGILEALDFIDYITIFEENTPLNLIQSIKPDVYTKGGDYSYSNLIGPGLGGDIIEKYGGRISLIPLVKENSTSQIIKNMEKIHK